MADPHRAHVLETIDEPARRGAAAAQRTADGDGADFSSLRLHDAGEITRAAREIAADLHRPNVAARDDCAGMIRRAANE